MQGVLGHFAFFGLCVLAFAAGFCSRLAMKLQHLSALFCFVSLGYSLSVGIINPTSEKYKHKRINISKIAILTWLVILMCKAI